MSIIIKSKIKEHAVLDDKPLTIATEFIEALEKHVREHIQKAAKRARANNRNTIMEKDL